MPYGIIQVLPATQQRRHSRPADNNTSRSMRFTWRRGVLVSGVRRMNEVNARRARLVLGWVTVFRRVHHLAM